MQQGMVKFDLFRFLATEICTVLTLSGRSGTQNMCTHIKDEISPSFFQLHIFLLVLSSQELLYTRMKAGFTSIEIKLGPKIYKLVELEMQFLYWHYPWTAGDGHATQSAPSRAQLDLLLQMSNSECFYSYGQCFQVVH